MNIFKVKCEEIRKKIPAYIDEELNNEDKRQLKEHIDTCLSCSKEFKIYSQQDKILNKLKDIEPSLDFNSKLFEKIGGFDVNVKNPLGLFLKWILPIPALCTAVLVIFMAFTLVAPMLYALPGEETGNGMVQTETKRSLISFMEFSSYCDKHCRMVCKYCQVKNGSKCVCGMCVNESKK